jgi:hypothetical protein
VFPQVSNFARTIETQLAELDRRHQLAEFRGWRIIKDSQIFVRGVGNITDPSYVAVAAFALESMELPIVRAVLWRAHSRPAP